MLSSHIYQSNVEVSGNGKLAALYGHQNKREIPATEQVGVTEETLGPDLDWAPKYAGWLGVGGFMFFFFFSGSPHEYDKPRPLSLLPVCICPQ
jgi:hypothetical protein